MLSVALLGPPRLALDGRPLNVTRRRSRALLYYLAAQDAPVSRERLLELFWLDHERAAAQQILRTNLHGLRKTLGAALLAQDDALALAPDSDVDTRRFAARLAALSSPWLPQRPSVSRDKAGSESPPRLDAATLSEALALYRGDFLAEFTLADAPAFDDWAAAEREHYRRLAMRGWAALARRRELARDWSAALDALERAIAFDPLQEDAQRAAMRLHYLSGDRAGAIRRYEQLRRLLDDELGVPPLDETRALYDAIVTDTFPTTDDRRPTTDDRQTGKVPSSRWSVVGGRSSSVLPFTGRAAELELLRGLPPGQGLALIEGAPGIGKTRLATEYLRNLDVGRGGAGVLVLSGAAHELEQALPYQPMIEALRGLLADPAWPELRAGLEPSTHSARSGQARSEGESGPGLPAIWLAEAARLLPELAAGQPGARPAFQPADESRLWEGINQLLLALARRRSLALFLDDLHWADAATLALLGYLVRQGSAPMASLAFGSASAAEQRAPIIFLAAARPAAPRSPLAALLGVLTREGRLRRIPLARLTEADTLALAHHLSSSSSASLATWLTRNAEGNPYILAELVREVRERGLLRPGSAFDPTLLPDSPLVPQTVYTLIETRLARLSAGARRVLDVAVAIGREFELAVAARAAGLVDETLLDALDELRAAGLIHPIDQSRYAFDHSLTIEVAYREVGEARHRLLHRRVAEAIETLHRQDLDAVAGLLASHFAEGEAPDRAAPYALRAGQIAAGLAAWKEAIAFYEQALAGVQDGARFDVLMALGGARAQAGAGARAAEAYQEALALALARGDAVAANAARLGLGRSLLAQARYAEAIELAQQVCAAGRPSDAAAAELLWGTALSVEGADLDAATEHLRAAEVFYAAHAELSSLAHIKFERGSVAAQQGDLPAAVGLYREALSAAEAANVDDALMYRILAHNNLAYHLHLLGDPAAVGHAEAGLGLAREQGAQGLLPYLLSTAGEIALAAGDLAAAERQFAEGLALAERIPVPERIAGLTANLGLVALWRGQADLAIHRLSTALARADALGTQHLAAQIRLWLAPLLPSAEARAYLAEARAIAENGGRKRLLDEVARLEADLPYN
jgi:DNA-binding SARP family transcriptional activator